MSRKKRRMDLLGAILGVSDVLWTKDIPDDGYRDFWGRAPLNESLYIGQRNSRESTAILIPRIQPPHVSGK